MERLESIKEQLISCVEGQIANLAEVNAHELGEAVDMIKDLEQAIYYCSIVKAMEENSRYYTIPYYYYDEERYYPKRDEEQYYTMNEGRSPATRRTYMEGKELHKDKTHQVKELEKYMQELSDDIVEMIGGASAEERQLLEKKMASLTNKIAQLNVNG